MIRVLIADDQITVRETLQSYLEKESDLEIVGFASDGQAAIEQVEKCNPDVVIMDIEMPVLDGLIATAKISERFANTQVLLFSQNDDSQYLTSAIKVGAKGYMLKTTSSEEIIKAIRAVRQGYFQLGPGLMEKYLYKTIVAESNTSDIIELKRVIQEQSLNIEKAIEKAIEGQGQIEKNLENSRFFAEIKDMRFESRNIKSRIRSVEQEIAFLQKFLLIFAVLVAIAGVWLIFVAMSANN